MNKKKVANWKELVDRTPEYALVADVDLVVVRFDDEVTVLYGRCAHRGALMSDGHVDGDNLICGVHGWDYRLDTGISEYNNSETLPKFQAWVEDGAVFVNQARLEFSLNNSTQLVSQQSSFDRDMNTLHQFPRGNDQGRTRPHASQLRKLLC